MQIPLLQVGAWLLAPRLVFGSGRALSAYACERLLLFFSAELGFVFFILVGAFFPILAHHYKDLIKTGNG